MQNEKEVSSGNNQCLNNSSSCFLEGCRCGIDGNCAEVDKKCNCDVNDNTWRFDEGYVTEKSRLPITELRFGDTGSAHEEGKHTLRRLECFD